MTKFVLFLLPAVVSLTACSSLYNINNNDDYHGRYGNERVDRDGRPLPPPYDRYGKWYNDEHGNYYGKPDDYRNHDGYNHGHSGYVRPQMGTMVRSLGVKNPRTLKVNGETIYEVGGVYYRAERTSSGVQYKVVGYSNR
ncbi:MAG: hypothetical protein J6S96_06270 [Muribaculaceae bacterium]|nr:hypothetical protein [Muribaculaceae bacterium]